MFFFNACGGTTTSGEESIILTVNAGSDRIVQLNELLTIEGKGTSSDGTELSYLWKKDNQVLATSAILNYKPTVLGVDILELFVEHNSGEKISDVVKITVIDSKTESKIPTISPSLQERYLNAINNARAESQDCGEKGKFEATSPLKWNQKIYNSSYEHSYDLAHSKAFSHDGSGTESDWTGDALGKKSILSERIEAYAYNWSFIGENIGAGTLIDTPEKMVKGWLDSDNHCANLMSPDFEDVGMAMVKNSDGKYTYYWTQDFGTER